MVVINKTRKIGVRKHVCYCSLTCYALALQTEAQSQSILERPHLPRMTNSVSKQRGNASYISHRHDNQTLTRNSYSGSCEVMHLGITEKPTRGCISCVYILYILSKVSEQTATEKCCRRQLRCRLTLPSAGTPSNIRIHLIFLETRIIGQDFCRR